MGSSPPPKKLPIVNISLDEPPRPGSPSWTSNCNKLRKGLEEYGFIEIVYDKPSNEMRRQLFEVMNELFKLSRETKMKNVSDKLGHGYMGRISAFPIHEGMGIEDPLNFDECVKFAKLMWPNGNDRFCEAVHEYSKLVIELYETIMKMLFEGYGIGEEEYSSHMESTNYLLRLLKYKRATEANSLIGFRPHSDKSFVTLIHQINEVDGLEVLDDDGEWVPFFPSSPFSFVLIAGDVSKAWSNDRIKSCFHRVIVNGEEVRYTLGLFVFLDGVIRAPKELVDNEHPLQYKPFHHHGLLDFFLSSTAHNKREPWLIKAYCGVDSAIDTA